MKSLQLEYPVDTHLKPIKDSDGVSTSVEISTEKIRVKDIEVTGTLSGSPHLTVDSSLTDGSTNPVENNAVYDGLALKLPLAGGTMSGHLDMGDQRILDAQRIGFNDGGLIEEVIDNDDMSSTSATKVSSSESIKAYVDSAPLGSFSRTIMKVMPTEFMVNDDYSGRAANIIEDDTADTLAFKTLNTNNEAYAFVKIPYGYDATHAQVFASDSTAGAVRVLQFNYQTGATVSKGTGDFNENIDITDVTSAATVDLSIKIAPGSTTTLIYGALVTIASS